MDKILEIDGSRGEGGGQIVRTSVSLAAILCRPIRIYGVRANRRKPGLQPQHLCAVQSLAQITGSKLEGAIIGSIEFSFIPQDRVGGCGELLGRRHDIDIGTAGSSTLVMQTLLPSFLTAPLPYEFIKAVESATIVTTSEQSDISLTTTITITGGTTNPMAPSAKFIQETFLPQLNAILCAEHSRRVLGKDNSSKIPSSIPPQVLISVHAEIERHGFYPAGGGRLSVHIVHRVVSISPLDSIGCSPFCLVSRGKLAPECFATCIVANLPIKIANREAAVLRASSLSTKTLIHAGAKLSVAASVATPCSGPGNAVFISLRFQNVTEVVTVVSERGRAAEDVADESARLAEAFFQQPSASPVSSHLADQLLLPLALFGGGSFRTDASTLHSDAHFSSNMDVIHAFLGAGLITISAAGAADCGEDRCTVEGLHAAGGIESSPYPWGMRIDVTPKVVREYPSIPTSKFSITSP